MKILVIGYGSIGKRHVSILSSWGSVDISIVTHQKISEFRTYKEISDISDLNSYDYFIISSATNLHYKHLSYINQNVSGKTILVEKPLFEKLIDFKPLNKVLVAYNLRFHPVLIKLKELLKNENVISVDVKTGQYLPTWRPGTDYTKSYSADIEQGGGVLLDLSHEIDYLLWLFGEIKTLYSINRKISDLKISSDDFVTAIGTFNSGIVFNFTMDYLLKESLRRIIINTNNSSIYADLIKSEIDIVDCKGNKKTIELGSNDRNISYVQMHKTILGYEEFSTPADIYDGLSVLQVITKIREENVVPK